MAVTLDRRTETVIKTYQVSLCFFCRKANARDCGWIRDGKKVFDKAYTKVYQIGGYNISRKKESGYKTAEAVVVTECRSFVPVRGEK